MVCCSKLLIWHQTWAVHIRQLTFRSLPPGRGKNNSFEKRPKQVECCLYFLLDGKEDYCVVSIQQLGFNAACTVHAANFEKSSKMFILSLLTADCMQKSFRMIPQYCIAHPYCARCLRH